MGYLTIDAQDVSSHSGFVQGCAIINEIKDITFQGQRPSHRTEEE
jgi:hypothetical protein